MLKDEVRQFYTTLIPLYTDREARHITHLVFEKVTGLSRLDLITKSDQVLTGVQQADLSEKLQQLLEHRPVQYVLGECFFYHLSFWVNEHVLIPRPETEELVEWTIRELAPQTHAAENGRAPSFTILDAGTGSGCIAIALKKNMPQATVMAMDNSTDALEIARQNAKNNQVDVAFFQANLLDKHWSRDLPPLDVIISNPPYIPEGERNSMQPQVTAYEPHAALFVPDQDPLIFYKALAQAGLQRLAPRGKIFVEIHEDLADATVALFREAGFDPVELRRDMNDRPRMICAAR